MPDMTAVLVSIIPLIKTLLYGVGGLILLAGAYYFFFHVLGVKKWNIRVYELTESGKLVLKFFDVLVEKKVMSGKRRIYWLKKAKVTTFPPGTELCQHLGGKDYADYLRIDRQVFAPMPATTINLTKEGGAKAVNMTEWAKKQVSTHSTKEVYDKFVYIPLHKTIKLNLKYDISYDVDQMRMNAIDLGDLMWQGTKQFWEKYGTLIVAGLMLICIIAIAVLSYEHIQKVMATQVDMCSKAVQEGITQGIRNAPPPAS